MNNTETTKYGVDLGKVQAAIKRMGIRVKPPGSYFDKEKAERLGRELVGTSRDTRDRPIQPAEDNSRRKYVSRLSKGCQGFLHPHFHP